MEPGQNIVRRIRQKTGLTQAALASAAGTSQPTIAAYESGTKVPSLRTLRRLVAAADLDLRIGVHPRLTREDRRSLRLHERIAQRLLDDPQGVLERAQSNLRRMQRLHPHARRSFERWALILEFSVEDIADFLVDPAPEFRELRAGTPFAGVLTTAERAEIYRQFREAEAER